MQPSDLKQTAWFFKAQFGAQGAKPQWDTGCHAVHTEQQNTFRLRGQLAGWHDAPTSVSSASNTPGSSPSKSDGNCPGTGSTMGWLGNGWALAGVGTAAQDVGEPTGMGDEDMSRERAAQTRDSKLAVFLDEPPGARIYFP